MYHLDGLFDDLKYCIKFYLLIDKNKFIDAIIAIILITYAF